MDYYPDENEEELSTEELLDLYIEAEIDLCETCGWWHH